MTLTITLTITFFLVDSVVFFTRVCLITTLTTSSSNNYNVAVGVALAIGVVAYAFLGVAIAGSSSVVGLLAGEAGTINQLEYL